MKALHRFLSVNDSGGVPMKYYLYNPLANNGIRSHIPEGAQLIDASKTDYPEFFAGLKEDDEVVLIGGDGTINYLINHVDVSELKKQGLPRGKSCPHKG